jgi:hypothetical protein
MVTFLRENTNRSASGVHERRASMRQQTADTTAFSIEAVLSTEQPVRMWDWDKWESIDEILLASGRTLAESVPLLDSHRTETINRVLGHVENVRTEGSDTVGVMLFDGSDPDAVKAFNKYRGNHASDVSVGYVVSAFMEVKPGETVTVEGRTFTAGARRLRIATAWVLNELSCVAKGADSKAKVRSAEDEPKARMSQVTDEEIAQLQTMQRSVATLNESRTESTKEPSVVINITNGTTEPAERSVDSNQNPAGHGKSERTSTMTTELKPETTGTVVNENEILKRGVQIECKRREDIKAIADGVRSETVDKAINDAECTVDKARELFLKDLQAQRSAPPAGSDAPNIILSGNRRERDCNETSLAMALAVRMGAKNIENVGHRIFYDSFSGQTKFERSDYRNKAREEEFNRNLERADSYRGIHSVDLCREALRISKIEEPLDRHELVTRAVSTPALSAIYTNAASSILISEIEQQEDSTLGWTREIEVKNYQENGLVRVDGGRLKKRHKGQKAAQSTIAATMEVVRVAHFANTLILDIIDIVDDSIGALKAAMDEWAVGVADLRPSLVYGMLATNAALKTDGVTLFHADHANTATSTALTAANLQTVLGKMGAQKDAAGTVLNLTSCYIVTGTGYSFVADQLANSAEIREAAAANGTKNPFLKHGLGTAADARLSAGYVDPSSDTAVAAAPTLWYLASKGGRHGATVAFLEGSGRMPKMSTKVLNSEGQYGLAIDISHSIGAGVSGYQGLQKAVG